MPTTIELDVKILEEKRRIIEEIHKIRSNPDAYGEEVEIVAKRATLSMKRRGYEYEFKLSDGRIVSNDEAWTLAIAGKIKNVIGSQNKGNKYIRTVGDGKLGNNLGAIPNFF